MKRKSRLKKAWLSNRSVRFVPALKKSMVTFTHWMLALALFPLVWATCKSLILMIPVLHQEGFQRVWIYLLGAAVYVVIDRFVAQPMTLYVFGHELTHVFSGIMSGAKIHSFKAKAEGGEVRLSKTNTFISLSPYIVPLYSVAILLMYWIIKHWWNTQELKWGFQFLLGASITFHLAMTLRAVHLRQPDLKGKGFFLSLMLILLGNAVILSLMLVGLFGKTPTLKQYGKTIYQETTASWQVILAVSRRAHQEISQWIP